jgi:hypothetical protein
MLVDDGRGFAGLCESDEEYRLISGATGVGDAEWGTPSNEPGRNGDDGAGGMYDCPLGEECGKGCFVKLKADGDV